MQPTSSEPITPFPVDPFVFVAATRYAIRRYFTDASFLISGQVMTHAATIKTNPGAVSAILREIGDFIAEAKPMAGTTPEEYRAIQDRWRETAEKLR